MPPRKKITPTERKLYYSITEVAQMTGLPEATLRFWETEFPQLSPRKGGRNIRQYTPQDIDVVKQIQLLVKDKKMTLSGAKEAMFQQQDALKKTYKMLHKLENIRNELVMILSEIEQ